MKSIHRNMRINGLQKADKHPLMKRIFSFCIFFIVLHLFILQFSLSIYPLSDYRSNFFVHQLDENIRKVINQLRQESFRGKLYEAVFFVSMDATPYREDFLKLVKKIAENKKFILARKDDEKADTILQLLHEFVFRQYSGDDPRISSVFKSGLYNCVSSTLIFNMVLDYFGLKSKAALVPKHTFSIFIARDRNYDAETTVRYGFNAGQERKFIDELRRITGIIRVPASQPNREYISNYQLISILFSQTGNLLGEAGKHRESLPYFVNSLLIYAQNLSGIEGLKITYYKVAIELQKIGEFEKSIGIMEELTQILSLEENSKKAAFQHFRNIFVDLINSKKFNIAIALADRYKNNPFFKTDVLKIAPNLFMQYADHLNKTGQFRSAINFIKQKSIEYPELKELIPMLFNNRIVILMQRKQFEKAVKIAEEGIQYDEKLKKYFGDIYSAWVSILIRENRQTEAYEVVKKIAKSPYRSEKSAEIISRFVKYYIAFLIQNGNISAAKAVLDSEIPRLQAADVADFSEYFYVKSAEKLLIQRNFEVSCEYFIYAAQYFSTGKRFLKIRDEYAFRLVLLAKEAGKSLQAADCIRKIEAKLGAQYVNKAKSAIYYSLALDNFNSNNYNAGLENVKKGLSHFKLPQLIDLLKLAAENMVGIYFQNNNPGNAIETAEKAYTASGNENALKETLKKTVIFAAKLYISQGKNDKARELLIRIKNLLQNDRDIERELSAVTN